MLLDFLVPFLLVVLANITVLTLLPAQGILRGAAPSRVSCSPLYLLRMYPFDTADPPTKFVAPDS